MAMLKAQLPLMMLIWGGLYLGLHTIARKRDGRHHFDRYGEVELYVWVARFLVALGFLLLAVVAQYEKSVSSFLREVLTSFSLLALIPLQLPIDAVGAFLLHRRGRHIVEQVFALNFVILLPYLILPPFLISEHIIKRRELLARQRLVEFAQSLPTWMRVTLLRLDRGYGQAKRRAELNLTRERSRFLAEKGLVNENKDRELKITELGRGVANVLRSPQAGVAGKEDVAPRKLGGRVLGSLPGVLRRIAS